MLIFTHTSSLQAIELQPFGGLHVIYKERSVELYRDGITSYKLFVLFSRLVVLCLQLKMLRVSIYMALPLCRLSLTRLENCTSCI